jgi:flagellar motor switch protein FliN/FliY
MADESAMSQDDIEKLLSQRPNQTVPAAGPAPQSDAAPADAPETPADKNSSSRQDEKTINAQSSEPPTGEGNLAEKDIEFLLNQAEKALESINSPANGALPQGMSAFQLQELSASQAAAETTTLDLVRDVELNLKIELGRTQMYLEDVLKLRKGSVVALDKLAGDPVDVFVNGRLVARGEVLVLNDNFCVRVTELITGMNAFN